MDPLLWKRPDHEESCQDLWILLSVDWEAVEKTAWFCSVRRLTLAALQKGDWTGLMVLFSPSLSHIPTSLLKGALYWLS